MYHAINIGDAHFDKLSTHLGDKGNLVIGAELRKPLLYAKNNGIPHVVLLGDIADKARLSYQAHKILLKVLAEFDGFLDIYIILGNHDWDEEECHSLEIIETLYELGMFKTVHVITKPEQRMIGGVCVNFLPYPCTEPLPKPEGYEAGRVCYGHFEVPGAIRDNGMKIKGDVVESDDDDVYIIGHLHTPHDVGNKHYVGTLYQTNFGESLPKSFTESKFRVKGGVLKKQLVRHANDPNFKLFNVTIEDVADLKQCHSKNPLHFFKLFIKEDVVLPDDWLAKNPQVLHTNSFKTQRDLTELVRDTLMIDEGDEDNPDVDARLVEYLEASKASKAHIKRALEILNTLSENQHG